MSESAARLSDDVVDQKLKSISGWQRQGSEISKAFNFKNYYETMAFVNAIAFLAHKSDHHPDLEVGYNKCRVRFSTHSAGGITEKDLASAAQIDKL
jgi:4a-hydroxytetrahydrobiopterin dehydratase